jgi:hypothetical protein
VVVVGQVSHPKDKRNRLLQMMDSICKISMVLKKRPTLNQSSKYKIILTKMPFTEKQNNLSYKHSQPTLMKDLATQITYVATPNRRSLSKISNSNTLLTTSQATIKTKATLAKVRHTTTLLTITQVMTNITNSITRMIRINTMIKIKAMISSITTKIILIKTIKINNMTRLKTITIKSQLLKLNPLKLKRNGHILIL